MQTKHYCDNPACGVEVMAGSDFCHKCGQSLTAPVAAQGQAAASQGAALQNPVAPPIPASNPGTGGAPALSPAWRQSTQQQNGFVDPALYAAQQPNQQPQAQPLVFSKKVNWNFWLIFWLVMLVLATVIMFVLEALIGTRFYDLINTSALAGSLLFVIGCFVTAFFNRKGA